MDEDDFRALIAELEAQLRDIDALDVADETHYTARDENTGEERLLEPREHLLAMLMAFDRFLAVRDGATFRVAMSRIAQFTDGRAPDRVVFLPVAADTVRRERDLSEAPNLSALRNDLHALIERIQADPGPPQFDGAS